MLSEIFEKPQLDKQMDFLLFINRALHKQSKILDKIHDTFLNHFPDALHSSFCFLDWKSLVLIFP